MALSVTPPSNFAKMMPRSNQAAMVVNQVGQADNPYTPGHWSQSYVIRIILGLLVTAGVSLALIRCTELILLWITPLDLFKNSVAGFIVWQSLEVVGVFVGAMMAVAGRNQMMALGLLLGIMVGFLTMTIFPTNPSVPTALYFAMPGWFAVAGVLGAWLGEKIWHPQMRRNMRGANSALTQGQDSSLSQSIRQAVVGLILAHIRWSKVLLAVAIILPVLWFTHGIVDWLLLKLNLVAWAKEAGLQKAWVETMIRVTVVVLCAAMVGAGTTHGIAHGFWTGVICGVLNLLLHVFIPPEDGLQVNEVLWELGWIFLLCVVSGGFGALAIPPIMYLAQKRRPRLSSLAAQAAHAS